MHVDASCISAGCGPCSDSTPMRVSCRSYPCTASHNSPSAARRGHVRASVSLLPEVAVVRLLGRCTHCPPQLRAARHTGSYGRHTDTFWCRSHSQRTTHTSSQQVTSTAAEAWAPLLGCFLVGHGMKGCTQPNTKAENPQLCRESPEVNSLQDFFFNFLHNGKLHCGGDQLT